MTYRECYEWGVSTLSKAGIEEAALDARILLEHVCHTERNDLYAHGERSVDEMEENFYRTYIGKRGEHIPLQHLMHLQNFMGLDFYVNEHVLIPRQDTEVLVEEILKDLGDGSRILDLCTGSGCIVLSLMHYSNESSALATDLSDKALEVAKRNAEDLGLGRVIEEGRLCFSQGDLWEAVPDGEKFDIIVSNPPYIASKVIETLMPEVKEHEPMMALDGGEDGLIFYRTIIDKAQDYLAVGGSLYFEIGYDQGQAVSDLLKGKGFQNVRVVKDYAGLDRVVCADRA